MNLLDNDQYYINYYDGTKKINSNKVIGKMLSIGAAHFSSYKDQDLILLLNMTHAFYHGTFSDCEQVYWKDLPEVAEHFLKDTELGLVIWTAKKRRMKPRKELEKDILESKEDWGLNEYDSYIPNEFDIYCDELMKKEGLK